MVHLTFRPLQYLLLTAESPHSARTTKNTPRNDQYLTRTVQRGETEPKNLFGWNFRNPSGTLTPLQKKTEATKRLEGKMTTGNHPKF